MFLSFFFLFLLHSFSLRFTQALSSSQPSSLVGSFFIHLPCPSLTHLSSSTRYWPKPQAPSPKPPSSTHFSICVCVLAWVSVFVFMFQHGFWARFLVVFVFHARFQHLSTHYEYEVLKIFDLRQIHVVHSQGPKQTTNYGAEIQLHIFVYSKSVHCLFWDQFFF